ncbi:ABC transporter permease subunit [Allobranchiibius huperziae]|uniref:Peptide/nickel transport system permease protein n=1 Tax=Allobranchiibius huperziae TaxID=1874116 RepID=A0A853DC06_9MICO|nr:peptide/nickel transport system permease protein [Allobranchiibius huperziae]
MIIESPDAASAPGEGDSAKEIEGKSPRQLAWMHLRRDKVTLGAGVVAALGILIAIAAPILVKLGAIDNANDTHPNLLTDSGQTQGAFSGASWSHPLGVTPQNGSDLLDRLLLGTTYSLVIAVGATVITLLLGTIVGIISGYIGGKTDYWLGRLIDLVLCFPQTLMLLALAPTFVDLLSNRFGVPAGATAHATFAILVLGLFGWPLFARVVRGQVLSLRQREFIEAATSLGATRRRIYIKELLPNLWAPFLVYGSLYIPQYISAEAALAYLGVSIQPPTPTLGNILNAAIGYIQTDSTFFLEPAVVIVVLVLAFNLLGDGLRDAFDPRSDR